MRLISLRQEQSERTLTKSMRPSFALFAKDGNSLQNLCIPLLPARINQSMNIAFIGLGNMGSAMATNLLKAGHTLTVYNRSRARADALKPLGARVATTPGEAAAGAEVAITMLADDHALESV